MNAHVNPMAGQPAPASSLIDVSKLVAAYYTGVPDSSMPEQRVTFGTSGHRGSSFARSFNEWHLLAITQAICDYRATQAIDGPLFIGVDTHALSQPACATALEVLAANGVTVMLSRDNEYTPTPAVSHAILKHNRERRSGLADGIVVTPSHNPPDNGGFKYNGPDGGPAGKDITGWIEARANSLLEAKLAGVKRTTDAKALRARTTQRYDFLESYVADLGSVVDMALIRDQRVRMGVDPMGGAGVHYWARIADRYQLDLSVVSDEVDATFRFMTLDWDGRIRMDPSSPYAMQRLVGLKDRFDVAFGCDTDHDRHGIVSANAGLMPSNHYLTTMVDYLFQHRPQWGAQAAIGKTVVSTRMLDLVAARLGHRLFEVPVGFKWFVDGLRDGSLGWCGEESAGATFLRHDGTVWTTDKDGIVPALLAAEMTARTGSEPGVLYERLADEFGHPAFSRVDAPATREQKQRLLAIEPAQLMARELAGESVERVLSTAPGNGEPIGGIKVAARSGWFAARPSGTEDIYKIYAESFIGDAHLRQILADAQAMVDRAMGTSAP